MRIPMTSLALLTGLAILVAACDGSSATTAPSEAPSTAPTAVPSTAPTDTPSLAPSSELMIGVVTDIGTVNDKNVNELTAVGAQRGADAIGAEPPPIVVPLSDADYPLLIQALIDQDFDIIVTAGPNLTAATAAAAKANPDIWFVGVDQAPCIDAAGDLDPTAADCSGDLATLLPQYIVTSYAEDQAGYLAGIVAASVTKSDVVGAVGGVSSCSACIRYIQGFELGALSVNPEITFESDYVSDNDARVGFADPVAGKTFGDQFIKQYKDLDVLFHVARLTGNGLIDAACSAGINAIGVDVDQHESYPSSQACIVTSAVKQVSLSVSDTIMAISEGTATGGMRRFDAANDGIGIAPFHDAATKLPADIQTRIDAALAAMRSGTLETCPEKCGSLK